MPKFSGPAFYSNLNTVWNPNRISQSLLREIKVRVERILGIFNISEQELCNLISQNDYDPELIEEYCKRNRDNILKRYFGLNKTRNTKNSCVGRENE